MNEIADQLKIILTSGVAKVLTSLNDELMENQNQLLMTSENQSIAVNQSQLMRAKDGQSVTANQNQ